MNEEIKIESNIPLPSFAKTGFTETLKKCKIGDSFVMVTIKPTSCHTIAQKVGMKIVTRRQPDGSYRIWRKA